MKFPYIKFPSKDPKRKWNSRPYISVKLIGPSGEWEGYALIDSGADRSLFNIEVADLLGIEFKENFFENFTGIEGGSLKASIGKFKLKVTGIDMTIILEAGFVDSPTVGAILGQEGFFDSFKIKFEKNHGIVEIIPVNEQLLIDSN